MAGGKLSPLRVLRGFGPRSIGEVIWALGRGRPRSLARDARRVASLMNPPPRVEGLDLVPPQGPFVLVGNHFEAPGLWVGWIAAIISDAVARARTPGGQELHWLVTAEWPWFEFRGRWVPNPLSSDSPLYSSP